MGVGVMRDKTLKQEDLKRLAYTGCYYYSMSCAAKKNFKKGSLTTGPSFFNLINCL